MAKTVTSAIIDLTVDPAEQRRGRWRTFLRLGVPVMGVALMIVVILIIALYLRSTSRQDALSLSNDLLDSIDNRIARGVSAYLDPATHVIEIGRDLIADGASGDRQSQAIAYASAALQEVPAIENLLFGDADGNYLLVTRGESDGYDAKVIRNLPEPRRVTWLHRDASGNVTPVRDDPADTYDPRTRPWFQGALGSDALFWTGAYIFFTKSQPGVTVSTAYHRGDGKSFVIGADITLDALSQMLSSVAIAQSGRAFILDKQGQLVAASGGNVLRTAPNGQTVARSFDTLDDPVAAQAYDHYRIEGAGHHLVESNGQRYVTTLWPLMTAANDWSVLIVVPENDLLGTIERHTQRALALSLFIVVIATGLAALLIRQGLRADRNQRLLRNTEAALARQSTAIAALAAEARSLDPSGMAAPPHFTEILAEATASRRAGIWRFLDNGRRLRCLDAFDRAGDGHTEGLELDRSEFPQFFAALLEGKEIETPDAAREPLTTTLYSAVMQPLGSRALLVLPAKQDENVVGAVWLDDAEDVALSRGFARAAAGILAARLGGAAPPSDVSSVARILPPRDEAAHQTTDHLSAELLARGLVSAETGTEFYVDLAVMAVHFTDPAALAARSTQEARCISDLLTHVLQEIAVSSGIRYLKLVGQEAVAASGLRHEAHALAQLADAAIALRERFTTIFGELDQPRGFRIGIDHGSAVGCVLGEAPKVFNIWGNAVSAAHKMAASAPPGTVQVTEAAYHGLHREFLFRPRGRFYQPPFGEARTFALASRL